MELRLTRDDAEVKRLFSALRNKNQVADLLEVSFSTIVYLLYRSEGPKSYEKFYIPKKNGGVREISAPISTLKILQKKLSYILYLVYEPRTATYGFCKERTIFENAQIHSKKRLVFNIDLENFFSSIHIGRVIGLFQSTPFNFPREVAILLAQICCFEGVLPQGAPTSPILSNMICMGLDRELQEFAKRNHCTYGRYGDDITFSSTQRIFSPNVVYTEGGVVTCGKELSSIIEKHSFSINESKTRVKSRNEHQEVTGLTVNKFANVPRSFIRQTRSMLYAWNKFGEKAAAQIYYEKFRKGTGNPPFSLVVAGRISFIKSIKGEKHPVYRKLFNQYSGIKNPTATPLPITPFEELRSSLWVVETAAGYIGTAFSLQNYGIVTCAHVINGSPQVTLHHWATGQRIKAVVHQQNLICDIAILKLEKGYEAFESYGLSKNPLGKLREQDSVTVSGFPNYKETDPPQSYDMKVSAKNPDPTKGVGIYVERFTVDRPLYGGMSGSPVVNERNEVMAIATLGAKTVKNSESVWGSSITPIYHLDSMK